MENLRNGFYRCALICSLALLALASEDLYSITLPDQSEETHAKEYSKPLATTASGEKYDAGTLSCSHHNLPFGTVLRIQNQHTGKSIDVKVNHRAAKKDGESTISLSTIAAKQLGIKPGSKIPVLATPIGLTTARLAPATTTPVKDNQIVVSFDPSAFNGQHPSPEVQAEEPELLSLSSNSMKSLPDPASITTSPTSIHTQNADLAQTHGEQHQRVQFLSIDEEADTPEPTINTAKPSAESNTLALPKTPTIGSLKFDLPLRAQFGAFSNSNYAVSLMNKLNAQGFETTILPMGALNCVVTKGTFSSQETASQWIKEVKRLHGRETAQVRL